MAEAIASFVFSKLTFIIENEAKLLLGVKEEIMSLENELKWIRYVIKSAEEKRGASAGVDLWLTELIDLAYDAEDVIEGYLLGVKWITIRPRHTLGKQIERIKIRARELSTRKSEYALEESDTTRSLEAGYMVWRRRIVPTAEVVGLQKEIAFLEQWLKHEVPERRVISIFGMGGLGKTTLAGKMFRSKFVSGYFQVLVWISVSQEYQLKALFIRVIKELLGYQTRFEDMDSDELKEEISNHMEGKRYLVVLDDLWEDHAWEQISAAFPNNGKGSRIILTTRKKEVALGVGHNHLELQVLNEEESWSLFCQNVLSVEGGSLRPDLVGFGREIVRKCCGLPLAIVVMGGFLTQKGRTPHVWSNILKRVTWLLSQDAHRCRPILFLSYVDLPVSLKSCFLLLGLFPEDYRIPAWKLKLLWIAEGFVQSRGDENMEDVADDYLEELAQRNMIQVYSRVYHDGPIQVIRVHDLLRDLAITEARKYGFLDIQPNSHYTLSGATSRSVFRRFALHSHAEETQFPNRKVRSVLIFDTSVTKKMLKSILIGKKMLRVLDLKNVRMIYLPFEIGALIFLHYLGLRGTFIEEVPASISRLVKLQTLDICGTVALHLPKSIWRLKSIRHLFLGTGCKLRRTSATVMKIFGKNILSLDIHGFFSMTKKNEGPSDFLVNLKSLRSLKIYGRLDINSSQKHNSYDQNLRNCFPLSLTELWLDYTDFKQHELNMLARLPKLKILNLQSGAFKGSIVEFPPGGFPELQFLTLSNLLMRKWTVADDAIPSLVHLTVIGCGNLDEIPNRIGSLAALGKIELIALKSLKYRIQENGEDWDKIKHIPFITVR